MTDKVSAMAGSWLGWVARGGKKLAPNHKPASEPAIDRAAKVRSLKQILASATAPPAQEGESRLDADPVALLREMIYGPVAPADHAASQMAATPSAASDAKSDTSSSRSTVGSVAVGIAAAADLGRLVRQRREMLGLTQAQFSRRAGVGRRFLSELENGKPTLEIGKVLGVLAAANLALAAGDAPSPEPGVLAA